jgi:hypothetical protein
MFKNRFIALLSIAIAVTAVYTACIKDVTSTKTVYFNDFENDSLHNIILYNASGLEKKRRTELFNGSKVLGRFNNNAVILTLDSLPEHSLLNISFDLYIHDHWEGDHLMAGTTIPDAWQVLIDDHPILVTTFSNGPYKQSYPDWYPSAVPNPARGDAADTTLPGACSLKGIKNGTSHYTFSQNIAHNGHSFKMDCRDALQPFDSICLKSWSIDNLRISTIHN